MLNFTVVDSPGRRNTFAMAKRLLVGGAGISSPSAVGFVDKVGTSAPATLPVFLTVTWYSMPSATCLAVALRSAFAPDAHAREKVVYDIPAPKGKSGLMVEKRYVRPG